MAKAPDSKESRANERSHQEKRKRPQRRDTKRQGHTGRKPSQPKGEAEPKPGKPPGRYCDTPKSPAVLASPKHAQTQKIFFRPFRFA